MSAYWDKALKAGEAARMLLQAGSYDGAVNRAYYAMFNAARAALEVGTDLEMADIRRHAAVLQLFSLHVVRPGPVQAKLSADINEAFQVRAIADYSSTSVPATDAEELIHLMDDLLRAIDPLISTGKRHDA